MALNVMKINKLKITADRHYDEKNYGNFFGGEHRDFQEIYFGEIIENEETLNEHSLKMIK